MLYKVKIEPVSAEDGGGFFATVPALPGCLSDGDSEQEARANIADAIECWLEAAKEMNCVIPEQDT